MDVVVVGKERLAGLADRLAARFGRGPRLAARYGLAVAAAAAAAGLRRATHGIFGDEYIFITFYPAIALVAVALGGGPGGLATVLGAVLGLWMLPPGHPAGRAAAVLFVTSGLLVGATAEAFRREHRLRVAGLRREVAERTAELRAANLGLHEAADEQRRAVSALRRSEDRFRQVFENALVGIGVADRDGRLQECNAAYAKLLGYSREVLVGLHLSALLHPEDMEDNLAEFERLCNGYGSSYELENRYVRRDGRPVWVRKAVSVLRDENGAPAELVALVTDVTERRRAEDALRSSEERLRLVLQVSDAVKAESDPGRLVATALEVLRGHVGADRAAWAEVEPDEDHFVFTGGAAAAAVPPVTGRFAVSRFGPEGLRRMRAGLPFVVDDAVADPPEGSDPEAYRTTGIAAFVAVPIRKDDRFIAGIDLQSLRPRRWTDREVELVTLVADRIWEAAERARTARALAESEERLRLAVRASNVGLWDWDLRTDRIVYSPEWKAQLGYADGEIGESTAEWEGRLHPEDRDRELARNRRMIAGPERAHESEFRMRHRDGSWRWIFTRAEVILDAEGEPVRMLGCHVDVTDRRRAEEALREREARLSAVLNTAADAIITIDHRGVIRTVNPATETLFGYEADEMVGRNVRMLMPPPWGDEHDGYLTRYLETGEARVIGVGREGLARRKDGALFPVDLAVSEVDHLRQFTGILRDATRRKQLERDVVEAASSEQRRIGQDLHDTIGQELTALNLLAASLVGAVREGPDAAAPLLERLTDGLRACQRELRVVLRGLLPVPVDREGLMAALADLADRAGREAAVDCGFDCPVPVAVADNLTATQLYLIAQEAVRNAVKHARPRSIRIALTAGDRLVLEVRDDGEGLPPMPRAGRGLGLRIMYNRAAIIGARPERRAGRRGRDGRPLRAAEEARCLSRPPHPPGS